MGEGHEDTLVADGDLARTPGVPAPVPSSELTPIPHAGAALDRLAQIEAQEHRADVERFRRGLRIGVILWLAFTPIDVLVDAHIQPGVLSWLLCVRFTFFPILPAALYVSGRSLPSPRMLRVLIIFAFGTASTGISLMCVKFGGLTSLYFAGVMAVLVCRGAFFSEPWRVGLLPTLIIWLIHPAVLLASALFDRHIRAQLGQPAAVSVFAVQ